MRYTIATAGKRRTQVLQLLLVALAISFAAPNVLATSIASWTFQTSPPTLNNSTTIGPLAADIGAGTASGHHASALSDWTSPVGNGSTQALSSTHWSTGDYYQFQAATTGLQNIVFDWDQTGSATSPAAFALQWSTDGTTFTTFVLYNVLLTVSPNPSWSSVTPHAQYHFHNDLSSVTNLNHQPAIYLRLTAQANASNVLGTDRVDNLTISGVPEPSSLVLAALGLIGFAA